MTQTTTAFDGVGYVIFKIGSGQIVLEADGCGYFFDSFALARSYAQADAASREGLSVPSSLIWETFSND